MTREPVSRSHRGRAPTALLLAVLFGALPACSYVFVRGAPKATAASPTCTSKRTWPIVDGVLTGVHSAGVILNYRDDDPERLLVSRQLSIALGAVGVAVHLSSAIYGMVKVNRCVKAKREAAKRAGPPSWK